MVTEFTPSQFFANWINFTQQSNIPFYSTLWHKLWLQTEGKNFQPLFLQINNNVFAPLVIRNHEVFLSGGKEISDYQDIVGSEENKTQAWPEILEYLKARKFATLILDNIPRSSSTYTYFRRISEVQIAQEDTMPIVDLPLSWDEFLSHLNRKHRHELKRKMKKFETAFPGLQVQVSTNPESDINHLFRLMKLNPDKQKFLTPVMEEFFRGLVKEFAKSTELLLLTVEGQVATVTFSFIFPDELLLYNSGFDEQNFSGSGFYLKAISLKRAIDVGIKRFNFLQGSERYKYEFGGKDFWVYRIEIKI
ncbi:TPA: hypothetical protein DIV55_04720 [Patescibacteria group bacterium]|uniref:BioF2-like acetyltransferase domain-containing protein n=1 Tax=Candidatus Gottesmanbacteria bacterium GW2011_GWA1_43_11 TaxID=1618436 RepID=A0A0G1CJ67_9BACT|nr:MAG: hypothetical protein UV59_C0004G0013 [Candidatus Gottesmanbacteria bacterium GW2011_GWA1_43_11]HCS79016.1 hypothetical protein [Patescibacteria group bacterium]